jgi:MoxR-like ATPase
MPFLAASDYHRHAMSMPFDPVRFSHAAARFRAFFDELHYAFIERDDVLAQIALALLCREHLLLTGPPGTAKSQLASAVFGRIIDAQTGAPSLYARQITENTVQTDLIGPLDFKTLMETGRTEHFTDEGMLGAVHAFLDEVFDGRDMLLRSALNVLHERELKQGSRITRGRIECALMTTNRHLSDILESSRENLLAFVDRIAFAGLVPRGFANPDHLALVLRRHTGSAAKPLQEATLTLQDLDVLQAATDAVRVTDSACDALAALLSSIDAELNAAARADPAFIPTRYVSTRTAVRSGKILRAIAVYNRIFHDPDRPLAVLAGDFSSLRLSLVLSGPSPDQIDDLLTRETDPTERRQLTICRTEREIFERCLGRMPAVSVPPAVLSASDHPHGGAPPAAAPSRPSTPVKAASVQTEQDRASTLIHDAIQSQDQARILTALRELIALARVGSVDAARTPILLKDAVAALGASALRTVLGASSRQPERSIQQVVADMVSLAAAVDDGSASTRALAKWLRTRALSLIDEVAAYAPGSSPADIQSVGSLPGGKPAAERVERRLSAMEELSALRGKLIHEGREAPAADTPAGAWKQAVDRMEQDIAVLWDAVFRQAVAGAFRKHPTGGLADVLTAIAPELDRLDAMQARVAKLHGGPSQLKSAVVAPRLGALLGAMFERIDARDRSALLSEIDALLGLLRRSGLGTTIAPRDWVTWAASALVRSDRDVRDAPADPLDYEGYRRLRWAEQRVSNAFTLAEIALRVAPEIARSGDSPPDSIRQIADFLSEIPGPLREGAVRLDLGRMERALEYLERWWQALAAAAGAGEWLEIMVTSRFFHVIWDESALVRFAVEARTVAEVFPDRAAEAAEIRRRADALQSETHRVLLDLFQRRADSAWQEALGARTGQAAAHAPPAPRRTSSS